MKARTASAMRPLSVRARLGANLAAFSDIYGGEIARAAAAKDVQSTKAAVKTVCEQNIARISSSVFLPTDSIITVLGAITPHQWSAEARPRGLPASCVRWQKRFKPRKLIPR